ncbi:MAG TPA: DNA repair protein RecO [Clostridiales bacterium]|nr:MAG: DNA repair protein RecO [Clostridiales bacterium GWD2_32_59]HAN09471.1 DNA repair protein RecO [Clostridiales bacterium]
MSVSKITGIVIKEVNLKESDKIITIFSSEIGKVQLYVKRAREIKSPFLAGTQLLTHASFVYTPKNNINFLNQISITCGFEKIKFDIEKIYYAMYFLEFLDKTVELESPAEDMFIFLVKILNRFNDGNDDIKLIRLIYELKMLALLGYAPEVTKCIRCESGVTEENNYFNFEDCGVVCEKCLESDATVMKLNKESLHAMQYILYIEIDKIFSFEISPKIIKELREIVDKLVKINIGQSFRTLDFLNKI